MISDQFSSLPLAASQLSNLITLGYEKMTPVQAQSLPDILNGKDLIAKAKTGSGKTAAFGLGVLQRLDPSDSNVQAMVICPTRELADQVGKELRKLARCIANVKVLLLCGGKTIWHQKNSLSYGAHVVVGTPGRIQDHLRRETLRLNHLKVLVLDEADRMLDMGFFDVIDAIIRATPKRRQTLLFSATYPDEINQLCASIQYHPKTVTIDTEHKADVIDQVFYEVDRSDKLDALRALFEHYKPATSIVFCYTKIQCDEVAEYLRKHRIEALAIHGDLEQRERDQVLIQFANKSCPVLVATDVAARGLDIKDLQAVINFELPRDPEVYVHRIGRTGRAGQKGLALSLFIASKQARIRAIEAFQNTPCSCKESTSLTRDREYSLKGPMTTIQLDVGRKNKIRPGDILGALTGDAGLKSAQIGKIEILAVTSYIAVERPIIDEALGYLNGGKVKGRAVRAREID